MNKEKQILSFLNTFDTISPYDLELIMEYFEDKKYLSEEGKKFRKKFWELFIKKI